MKHPSGIKSKLKTSDPKIKNYVIELEKENLKLQVENVSQQNQITAIKNAQPKQIIKITNYGDKKSKKQHKH